MKRTAAGVGAITIAVLAPTMAAAQNGPALRLYAETGFAGESHRVDRGVENLNTVRFGDRARSMIAEGRWEVCLDAGYRGGCRVVQGRVSDMGDWNARVSSVHYLGPSDWGDGGDAGGAPEGSWHGNLVGRDPTIEAAVNAQLAGQPGGQTARLVLFEGYEFGGRSVSLDRDTPNLHIESLDFGDYTWSLAAEGRWSLCEDVDYGGECRTYEGDHATLQDWGGTISSARYLGPGESSRVLAGSAGGDAGRRGADDRTRQPGAVETATERAARVAAEEAERRVHDRIREGVGRLF